MSVESIIMHTLKENEHGVRFTQTVEQILATTTERILLEDLDGCLFLEKVGAILHHYIEFNLMEAIQSYVILKPDLDKFAKSLENDQESTPVRVKTWGKIINILDMLMSDGVRFLGIAASGVERIQ